MPDVILEHEAIIRLAAFVSFLGLIAGAEFLWPRRVRRLGRLKRWFDNIAIAGFNTLVVRLILPAALAGAALFAEAHGYGLFNQLSVPLPVAGVISFLALDFAVYVQHIAFHATPALWRLHRMHHIDLDFDTTTGIRFHPFEIVASLIYKSCVVIALGAPAVAVVIFEIALNATSLFNHANIHLPVGFDRYLRLFVVTPDMHRVHHSIIPAETNSNFGFNFPWWDRILGTYRSQPRAGHTKMRIGVPSFDDPNEERFDKLLFHPLRRGVPNPPVARVRTGGKEKSE